MNDFQLGEARRGQGTVREHDWTDLYYGQVDQLTVSKLIVTNY